MLQVHIAPWYNNYYVDVDYLPLSDSIFNRNILLQVSCSRALSLLVISGAFATLQASPQNSKTQAKNAFDPSFGIPTSEMKPFDSFFDSGKQTDSFGNEPVNSDADSFFSETDPGFTDYGSTGTDFSDYPTDTGASDTFFSDSNAFDSASPDYSADGSFATNGDSITNDFNNADTTLFDGSNTDTTFNDYGSFDSNSPDYSTSGDNTFSDYNSFDSASPDPGFTASTSDAASTDFDSTSPDFSSTDYTAVDEAPIDNTFSDFSSPDYSSTDYAATDGTAVDNTFNDFDTFDNASPDSTATDTTSTDTQNSFDAFSPDYSTATTDPEPIDDSFADFDPFATTLGSGTTDFGGIDPAPVDASFPDSSFNTSPDFGTTDFTTSDTATSGNFADDFTPFDTSSPDYTNEDTSFTGPVDTSFSDPFDASFTDTIDTPITDVSSTTNDFDSFDVGTDYSSTGDATLTGTNSFDYDNTDFSDIAPSTGDSDFTQDGQEPAFHSDVPVTATQPAGGFTVDTLAHASGFTGEDLQASVTVSGSPDSEYDKYVQTSIDSVRHMSNIALRHGTGLPLTLRMRTRHRVNSYPPTNLHISGGSTRGSSVHPRGSMITIDGSSYPVVKAPLLYKYSDDIRSPDAGHSHNHHYAKSIPNINSRTNVVSGSLQHSQRQQNQSSNNRNNGSLISFLARFAEAHRQSRLQNANPSGLVGVTQAKTLRRTPNRGRTMNRHSTFEGELYRNRLNEFLVSSRGPIVRISPQNTLRDSRQSSQRSTASNSQRNNRANSPRNNSRGSAKPAVNNKQNSQKSNRQNFKRSNQQTSSKNIRPNPTGNNQKERNARQIISGDVSLAPSRLSSLDVKENGSVRRAKLIGRTRRVLNPRT